jgi:diguanylate cyclase (GGDEF)-like protein
MDRGRGRVVANGFLFPDLGRASASSLTRVAAAVTAILLLTLDIAALGFEGTATVASGAFVPVCATVWFGAGALTAFLLYGQFFVTESVALLIFASAYEFGALIALPYLLSSPGVTLFQPTQADLQLRAALWAAWHLVFAVLVCTGFAVDPLLERRFATRRQVQRSLLAVAVGTALCVVTIAALLWTWRGAIPVTVVAEHSTAFYRHVLAPLVGASSFVACGIALLRGRGKTSLSVWVAVATASAGLDAIVNAFSRHEYSWAWYTAKIQTTLTASIVLIAMLVEIAFVYRRMARLSTHDALTGVLNRRGLDERMRRILFHRPVQLAMLVIDVDHFKRYNDHYGHPAGDAVLRHLADVLREVARSDSDVVARIGGEEFLVVLTDVTMAEAISAAERLQAALSTAQIVHVAAEHRRLTVSIGISHADGVTPSAVQELFADGDHALYQAKNGGRGRYAVAR